MSSFLDSTGLSRLVSKITDYFAKKDGTYPDMTTGMASHLIPIAHQEGTNISSSRRYAMIAQKQYSSNSRPGEMFRLFVNDCYVDFKTFGSIDVSNQSATIYVCSTTSFAIDESAVYKFLKITWVWDSSSSSIYVRIYVDFNTLNNRWVSLFQFAGQSGTNYGETWTPYTGYDNIFSSNFVGHEVTYQWDRAYLFGGAVYAQKIGQYESTTRIGSSSQPVYVQSDGSVNACGLSLNATYIRINSSSYNLYNSLKPSFLCCAILHNATNEASAIGTGVGQYSLKAQSVAVFVWDGSYWYKMPYSS